MHWNAQGITTPALIIELELVLQTVLKPNHKFKLKNFKVYREYRITYGGGF